MTRLLRKGEGKDVVSLGTPYSQVGSVVRQTAKAIYYPVAGPWEASGVNQLIKKEYRRRVRRTPVRPSCEDLA
jgi:hypothetical protein